MFDCFENRVMLSGTLTTETALRIGAGRATGVTGTDLPVVRDITGKPFIPGSSFKGALRASVESLVRTVVRSSRDGACNPVGPKKEWCLESAEGLTDDEVQNHTCLVCRVFGSPWLASKVSIRDLLVDETLWFGQFEVRNGVAIDRDTQATVDQKLYDFEVVPAGTRFRCEIVVENAAEDWELGLLMAGLRSFERGEASLGGARSRGLGVVKIDWDNRRRVDQGNLLKFLMDESAATQVTDDDVNNWIKAFFQQLKGIANAQTTVQ